MSRSANDGTIKAGMVGWAIVTTRGTFFPDMRWPVFQCRRDALGVLRNWRLLHVTGSKTARVIRVRLKRYE